MAKKKEAPKKIKKEKVEKVVEVAELPVVDTSVKDARIKYLYALLDTLKEEGITRISDLENKIAQELK